MGVRYACNLAARQKIKTYLCAASLSCNGKFDGKGGGACNYVPKAKGAPCVDGEVDPCGKKTACDGKTSECPVDSPTNPELHAHQASITILPPEDPKKLYTCELGSYIRDTARKIYILDTARSISFKVDGVHSAAPSAPDPSSCKQYTLHVMVLYKKGDGNLTDHFKTKSMIASSEADSDLVQGGEYRVCAIAINDVRSKVKSEQFCSKGILIDRSPPSTGTIYFYADATCKQNVSTVTSNVIRACWANFEDKESCVQGFQVERFEVTISKIENDMSPATLETLNVSGTKHSISTGVNISDGSRIQLSIVAFNYVNRQSSSKSPVVLYDSSPPEKGTVDFVADGLVSFLVQNKRQYIPLTYDALGHHSSRTFSALASEVSSPRLKCRQ